MDLFEAYPHLREESDPVIRGRALRLIGVSAIVYDDRAFYFEISGESFWTRSSEGKVAIGVGGVQRRPDSGTGQPPLDLLLGHLRSEWRCDPRFAPATQTYVVEGANLVSIPGGNLEALATPFLMILTAPRLGGGPEVPDALAQAVYLIPTEERPCPGRGTTGVLRVSRESLGDFLAQEEWAMLHLLAQPWATLETARPLPNDARLRPVLALRGLRQLWQAGLFPMNGGQSE